MAQTQQTKTREPTCNEKLLKVILQEHGADTITEVWTLGSSYWIFSNKPTFPDQLNNADETFEGWAYVVEFEQGPISKKGIRELEIRQFGTVYRLEQIYKDILPCTLKKLFELRPELKRIVK